MALFKDHLRRILTPVDFDPFADHPATETLPLTDAQQEVWAAAQMGSSASASFNQCFVLHLKGRLSAEALRSALQGVVARHDALRTTFAADGRHQTVAARPPIEVPVVDLSCLDSAHRARVFADFLHHESVTPLNLGAGPLIRATLVKESDGQHVLVLTVHHIVCDGWSFGVILSDLAQLYGADRFGMPGALPELDSYREYVRTHAGGVRTADVEKSEAYWRQQLAGPLPVIELPSDRPRPRVRSYRAAAASRVVDRSLYRALKQVSARERCTLYATLLAGFQVFLARITGESDLIVGIPVAGQAQLPHGNLVGHCVNMLPLRVHVDLDAAFGDQLRRTTRGLIDAQDHQALSFGSLVSTLNLPRDLSRNPLVSVTFNVYKTDRPPVFDGLQLRLETPARSFVNFDLVLDIADSGDDLTVRCTCNADLFDRDTIDRWLGHYLVLLANVAKSSERRNATMPLLTDADREQLLTAWNDTDATFPRNVGVHTLVEAQAAATPGAIAVEAGCDHLTYAELDARANQLARHLRKLGVGRDTLVGLCVDRSLDMIVGLLGILKSGAAYIPLDASLPTARIESMLEDARPRALVTECRVKSGLPRCASAVVCIDSDWPSIAAEPAGRLDDPATGDDLAYVIYTSGSTGKPKGVQIPHRALVNFLCSMRESPGLAPDDVLLAVTTLSFDIAALEIFLPLIAGARLIMASRDEAIDGIALGRLIEAHGITVLQATPSTWRLLVESGWTGAARLKALCGGEALTRTLADELIGRCASVWNMYGPTETTVWSSVARVTGEAGPVPLGDPIANTRLYVLDTHGQLVPAGVPGELHIGGDGVARGYLQRPALTAARFIDDPFSAIPGARLYKTGDLVLRRADGRIEFLGRLDDQVKVRGCRIELGEIESVMRTHPDVRQVVVRVHEQGPEKLLVAYVATRLDGDALLPQLRAKLQSALPEYMIPGTFVLMRHLPLTSRGKVDLAALPSCGFERDVAAATFVAPRSAAERMLAALWADVLEHSQIGIHDNFFDLGGNSIAAAQLMARVRSTFSAELPVRTLFVAPTIAGLAEAIEASRWTRGHGGMPGVREEIEL
jgi:amino acid adenylation domain-containing protein